MFMNESAEYNVYDAACAFWSIIVLQKWLNWCAVKWLVSK